MFINVYLFKRQGSMRSRSYSLYIRFLILLMVMGFSFCSGSAWAAKYAVLVGVGRYSNRYVTNLDAPSKDVEKMRRFLVVTYKFKPKNIRILKEKRATKLRIVRALRWLARVAKPGDVAVFYFSGHGSRVTDVNGDEADGFDETLVPYDVSAHRESHIIDDEINEWISTVRTRKLTILFDSCHSGGGTKGVGVKYWPNPFMKKKNIRSKNLGFSKTSGGFKAIAKGARGIVVRLHVNMSARWRREYGVPAQAPRSRKPRKRKLRRRLRVRKKQRYTFIAASLSNQFAFDAGNPMNSVLTHLLLKVASKNPEASVGKLMRLIKAELKSTWMMTPNAIGDLDRPLFYIDSKRARTETSRYLLPRPSFRASVKKCNAEGFCAHFRVMNTKWGLNTHFRNGEEIWFAFKLNRGGHVMIMNRDAKGVTSEIFPKNYYQVQGKSQRVYHVRSTKVYRLPPGGTNSPAGFEMKGKIGSKEYVELIATEKDIPRGSKVAVFLRKKIKSTIRIRIYLKIIR